MLTLSPRLPRPLINIFPATGRPEGDDESTVMSMYPYDGRHPYFNHWMREDEQDDLTTVEDAEFSWDEYADFVAERVCDMDRADRSRQIEIPVRSASPVWRFSISPHKHNQMRSLFAKIGYVWDEDDRRRPA